MQTPITYGAGPYEVTYIDTFGRLCSARYQFLDGARLGFEIARRMSARLWFHA